MSNILKQLNNYSEWYVEKVLPFALKEIIKALPYFILGWIFKKVYEIKGIDYLIIIGITAGIYYLALISKQLREILKH